MCGRYTLTNPAQLELRFDVTPDDTWTVDARYNIAPSQMIPVIVEGEQGRVMHSMRWGFQPRWAAPTSPRPAPINARAETLLERPLFRGALGKQRCLIPADGFYEWMARPGAATKQPMYIHRRDGDLFAFAGLYTEREEGGQIAASCAIITTAPNEVLAPIHDRMPAILTRDTEALWIDRGVTDHEVLLACLRPYPPELLDAYAVAPAVSAVRNDAPYLTAPLAHV